MSAVLFDPNVPPSQEDERAAEINARLDDECDRAIARDDKRDWRSSASVTMPTR